LENKYILKELIGFDGGERRGVEEFLSECFSDLGWEYSEYDRTEDGKIFGGILNERAKFWRLFDGDTLVGTVAVREIADRSCRPDTKNDGEIQEPNEAEEMQNDKNCKPNEAEVIQNDKSCKPNTKNDGEIHELNEVEEMQKAYRKYQPNEVEEIKSGKNCKPNEKNDSEIHKLNRIEGMKTADKNCRPNEAEDKRICELKRFYVKRGCQGRGLGRFLMKTALDYAKDAGYDIIRADTETVCKSSIHIMESSGFSQIPSYNENIFAELFYELSLKE
jgi:GNAT superfamily N-acetyltransferase